MKSFLSNISNTFYINVVCLRASRFPCFDDAKILLFTHTTKVLARNLCLIASFLM